MSRSVSIHRNSVATTFVYLDHDEDDGQEVYDDFVFSVRSIIGSRFKSMRSCDRWDDREDRVVMSNGSAGISISEYFGLCSVCLIKEDDSPLTDQWLVSASRSFMAMMDKNFSTLRKVGTFSNGEAVFGRR